MDAIVELNQPSLDGIVNSVRTIHYASPVSRVVLIRKPSITLRKLLFQRIVR
jgi:hypothetical protein